MCSCRIGGEWFVLVQYGCVVDLLGCAGLMVTFYEAMKELAVFGKRKCLPNSDLEGQLAQVNSAIDAAMKFLPEQMPAVLAKLSHDLYFIAENYTASRMVLLASGDVTAPGSYSDELAATSINLFGVCETKTIAFGAKAAYGTSTEEFTMYNAELSSRACFWIFDWEAASQAEECKVHLGKLFSGVLKEKLHGISETAAIIAGVILTNEPISVLPTNYHGEVVHIKGDNPDSVVWSHGCWRSCMCICPRCNSSWGELSS
jgi:hypothetical protein